jgi:hypothetical protein
MMPAAAAATPCARCIYPALPLPPLLLLLLLLLEGVAAAAEEEVAVAAAVHRGRQIGNFNMCAYLNGIKKKYSRCALVL